MDIAGHFGENLACQRKRADLSQEQLAVLASLHRTEISLLERGMRMPRIDSVIKLAGSTAGRRARFPPAHFKKGSAATIVWSGVPRAGISSWEPIAPLGRRQVCDQQRQIGSSMRVDVLGSRRGLSIEPSMSASEAKDDIERSLTGRRSG
jgi:DNA-binding XRE family transcriptional regulator